MAEGIGGEGGEKVRGGEGLGEGRRGGKGKSARGGGDRRYEGGKTRDINVWKINKAWKMRHETLGTCKLKGC